MKEYRPTSKDGNVDIMWPKHELLLYNAMGRQSKIRVEVPLKVKGTYEVIEGRLGICQNSGFYIAIESGDYSIEYAAVHSIEVLQPEPEQEELGEGMWHFPQNAHTDFRRILEQRNGHLQSVLGCKSRRGSDPEQIVDAHNAVIEKLNERTIRQVCEDSGIPIKMTGDGVVEIEKADDGLHVHGFGTALKIAAPDRIVLEYGGYPDVSGRRIIIDGDGVEIIDSSAEFHKAPEPGAASVDLEESEVLEYEE